MSQLMRCEYWECGILDVFLKIFEECIVSFLREGFMSSLPDEEEEVTEEDSTTSAE